MSNSPDCNLTQDKASISFTDRRGGIRMDAAFFCVIQEESLIFH